MWRKVITLISLVMFCTDSSNARISTKVDVRFRILQKTIVAVPVSINGRGPFEFVVDTGTETSLIDSGLARELGLKSTDCLTLFTANSRRTLARSFLPQVALGAVIATNIEVLEDHLDSISALNPGLRGVLGQNFLSQFDLLLDYEHSLISFFLNPTEAQPSMGTRIPLRLFHGRPVVTAKASDDSRLNLLLDSGTSHLMLFKPGITGFRTCGAFYCDGTLRTAVAVSQVTQGVLSALSIGDVSLHNIPAFFSAQRTTDDPVDGMLPTGLFRNLYINNHEGYAVLNYKSTSQEVGSHP